MIFIEGAPGTGKSKGVIHNIKRIAATINPDILKDAWYAHVTEDSAQEAIDSIGLEGGKAFNKEGLMNKIVKNHQELKPEILKINRGKDSSGKDIIEEVKGTKLKQVLTDLIQKDNQLTLLNFRNILLMNYQM